MLGLFLGELIFGWAYFQKEFCISKLVGIDNKTASTNSPQLIFRRAYFWEGLLSEFYGINFINFIYFY